jgi:CRP-like cAMP-binding protein
VFTLLKLLATDIFFIAKGTVLINFTDTTNNSYDNFRSLNPGDHFGEIGIVYSCLRTASAITNDYCTFARLPIKNYERLVGEIPEFHTELKRYVQSKYNDDPVK